MCRLPDFQFTYKGETTLKITNLNRSSGEDGNRKIGTRKELERKRKNVLEIGAL